MQHLEKALEEVADIVEKNSDCRKLGKAVAGFFSNFKLKDDYQ